MSVYYVSPFGDDANSGESPSAAVQHVMSGAALLQPGDRLILAEGVYAEHVTLKGLARVEICSAEGQHAILDGAIEGFRVDPGAKWRPGAVPGEFVSVKAWPARTNRGALLPTDNNFTRLLTYAFLEDLQADNEEFGPLLEGEGPLGTTVQVPTGEPLTKRPYVYMGPGLFQGDDRLIHVRLRHTSLDSVGASNYVGPQDARVTPLAIWTAPSPTLRIIGGTSVHIHHLTVRFGGGPAVALDSSTGVWLDHVRVLAGPYGVEVGQDCENTTISNCTIDGGLPPWHFRSDRKDDYTTLDGVTNELAAQTTKALISCAPSSGSTTVEQCEIAHGHDLQLNGPGVVFRANWVHDINDDAIFVGDKASDLRITENVFEECLTVLSLASKATAGPVSVYRNLVDLRRPTRHRRPAPNPSHLKRDERQVLRSGNFFKSNFADPDLNVLHNTIVIVQSTRAVHNLFNAYDGQARRQVLNNIFVGIDNDAAPDRPLAYLPKVTDNAVCDGNCYHGILRTPRTLLQVRDVDQFTGLDDPALTDYLGDPPVFEELGTDLNPRLRRFWGPLSSPFIEDLRLADGSPAAVPGGAPLTDPFLRELDHAPPAGQRPTIGCYRDGAPPMAVGVDGLRFFPSNQLVAPGV